MHLLQTDGLHYFAFKSFLGEKITHAVFTRRGGVSPPPWAGLNLGGSVGDSPQNVAENKRRALQAVGRTEVSVFEVWQVHSSNVVRADLPRLKDTRYHQADAIITNQPEITLLMRFADCVPILIYDPIHRAVGLVHAGWQGTVKKIITHTIDALQKEYSTNPSELIVGIGPSICLEHYEVGLDVVSRVQAAFGTETDSIVKKDAEKTYLDLWLANRLLLEQAGVRQIEVAGICTACHPEDWFSHRRENGRTGRFGVLIALKE